MFKNEETIADLVKSARKQKKISARKLATLVGVSHTEINNIESGFRVKPSILVLKGFEKYLEIPFQKTAKLAGYSNETIKYGDDEIVVSYEMYDKKLSDYKDEIKHLQYIVDLKRHNAMDISEYFKEIHEYLNKQNDIDETLLNKANSIEKLLSEIERKYESISKEK
ncbi:MAG: helix-turn-helix domain-containing protein [Bacilli bacterium]|nr:helix-turn-helix domain-containing protein [Bacilli bacterium]